MSYTTQKTNQFLIGAPKIRQRYKVRSSKIKELNAHISQIQNSRMPTPFRSDDSNEVASGAPLFIPIRCGKRKLNDGGDEPIPEYALIEINGELLLPTSGSSPSKNENRDPDESARNEPPLVDVASELELGAVDFVNDKPIMILGSHELKGTIEDLKQPFCVLKKEHDSSADDGNKTNSQYTIQGVITKKILFNQYPKIIMR
jgi:Ctf8